MVLATQTLVAAAAGRLLLQAVQPAAIHLQAEAGAGSAGLVGSLELTASPVVLAEPVVEALYLEARQHWQAGVRHTEALVVAEVAIVITALADLAAGAVGGLVAAVQVAERQAQVAAPRAPTEQQQLPFV